MWKNGLIWFFVSSPQMYQTVICNIVVTWPQQVAWRQELFILEKSVDFIFGLISPVLLSLSLSRCSWFVLTALLHRGIIPSSPTLLYIKHNWITCHLSSIDFLIYCPIYPSLVRCLVPECLCMLVFWPAVIHCIV